MSSCPRKACNCLGGTPAFASIAAAVCPYGIIRTNRKTLVVQGLPRTRTTTKPPLRAFKKRYLINHGDTFFRKCPHSIE
jgi:hypothetical protein